MVFEFRLLKTDSEKSQIGPKCRKYAKMGSCGVFRGANFGFLRLPDHLGGQKYHFSTKLFLENNIFGPVWPEKTSKNPRISFRLLKKWPKKFSTTIDFWVSITHPPPKWTPPLNGTPGGKNVSLCRGNGLILGHFVCENEFTMLNGTPP